MGRTFFTPGPSQLYPTVASHMEKAMRDGVASISHRSKEFEEIFERATSGLRELFEVPAGYHIWFFSSATEIWERIAANCIQSSSYHLVNGAFSRRFGDYASLLGKSWGASERSDGKGFDIKDWDGREKFDFMAVTICETSTGVWTAPEMIEEFAGRNPDVKIVADMVSAAPHAEMDMEKYWASYFSVQKGFGLPAGLGVLIIDESAVGIAEQVRDVTSTIGAHNTFPALAAKSKINQTPSTPNVLLIHLLGEVVKDMKEKGLANIRTETSQKFEIISDMISTCSFLDFFVEEERHRSPTCTVATVDGGSNQLIAYLAEQNFIVGNGYGKHKGNHIRIANFPAHTVEATRQLCEAIKKFK